jgi:uncharacterized protein (TIGR03067 family)
MRRYLVTFLLVGLSLAADAPNEGDAKKDAQGLQGTWKVVSSEQGGKVQDEAKDFVMIFEKDTFQVKKGDELIVKGTFKLDPSKSPKAIDMTITEAKKEDHKGMEVHGIYQLDKGTLKWCAAEPGETERPTEFATKQGTKLLLVTFQKDKP